jgi:O-antigen/teichoic acid export membrane protein
LTGSAAGRPLQRSIRRAPTEIWGLVDQSVSSGANFITVIVLARVLSIGEFGYFVLAFTLLQLATALQTALVTRPHNVLAAARSGDAYRNYTHTAAVAQIVLAATLTLGLVLGAGLAQVAGASHASTFLAAAPALASWQIQEFGRRVLYTEGRLIAALVTTVVTYGGYLGFLAFLWQSDALSAVSAFQALAVAAFAGAFVAGIQLRSSLSGRVDRSCARQSWEFGRWLAAADVGYWLSSNFYVYLAAVVLGPMASAVLKAAQTLLGPVSVFQAFFLNYLPVRFARALGDEVGEGQRLDLRRGLVVVTSGTVPYCFLVALLAAPLLQHVYGDKYADDAATVRLFAAYYILLSISLVIVAAVSARQLGRQIFVAQAAGAVVSLAVGWPLLEAVGPPGAVMGMILSWTASTAILWRAERASGGGSPIGRIRAQTGAAARGVSG